jgi:hypothetical protein
MPRLGRLDGSGAAAAALVAAVLAAGRLEVRYVPASGGLPAATSALFGLGF